MVVVVIVQTIVPQIEPSDHPSVVIAPIFNLINGGLRHGAKDIFLAEAAAKEEASRRRKDFSANEEEKGGDNLNIMIHNEVAQVTVPL